MRRLYLTSGDVKFIYEDLKTQGLYEWYVTLRCIEEIQCDYTFISKLTWSDLIYNNPIIDVSGSREKKYIVPQSLIDELHDMIDIMDIENFGQLVVRTPAKELWKHICSYDCIRKYNEYSKFRIEYFREYTVDINGVRTYAMKTVNSNVESSYTDGVSTYSLYIAEIGDKNAATRPEKYRLKFYDKKIGIAKNVGDRMLALSNDKRMGGTLSPLYVKGLRAWHMSTKLCRSLETEMHRYFQDRGTGGEWFTDYDNDLIKVVEKRIKQLKKEGKKIVEISIDNENEDISFLSKLSKEDWEDEVEEFVPIVKYEI